MRDICPICEKRTEIERVSTDEAISVRSEEVLVPVELLKCSECGESFADPKAEYGPVELAYREFRKRKGLLQPEEIRGFRNRLGLTQSELGELLCVGIASISRWENGALQDAAHDKALRLAMDPQVLIRLVEDAPRALSQAKRADLLTRLSDTQDGLGIQLQLERISSYKADDLSGFKNFDYSKFVNAVLLFCKEGTFTTNLNKLLFYVDFLHFKKYAVSLTGLRYAHMPYGPAPDKYHSYFAHLSEGGLVESEEVSFPNGSGERFHSSTKPDLHVFEESELRCILHVKETFEKKSAKEISEISHKELAYTETGDGELISYTHAGSLSLDL